MPPSPQARCCVPPAPAEYRPDPTILSLGEPFLRCGRTRIVSAGNRPVPQRSMGRRGGPEPPRRCTVDQAFRTVRAAARQCAAAAGRFAITAISFGCIIPTLAMVAGSCTRRCAMRADGCSTWGTKGSGQTPWSRNGDGRLTLKGGVREILATEMLEALGVNTSKSFSLIETGEALERGDEPSPTRSAVLVRLSHGHIRIGAFSTVGLSPRCRGDAAADRLCAGPLLRRTGG